MTFLSFTTRPFLSQDSAIPPRGFHFRPGSDPKTTERSRHVLRLFNRKGLYGTSVKKLVEAFSSPGANGLVTQGVTSILSVRQVLLAWFQLWYGRRRYIFPDVAKGNIF